MTRQTCLVAMVFAVVLVCFGNALAQTPVTPPPGIPLTTGGGNKYMIDWSPDGQWIAYALGSDVFLIPSAGVAPGQSPINLTASIPYDCGYPQFTPDSQRVIFSKTSSPFRIESVNLTGNNLEVVVNDGRQGNWNNDGTLLAYFSPDLQQIKLFEPSTNQHRVIYSGNVIHFNPPEFTTDGQHILCTLPTENGNNDMFQLATDGSQTLERLTFGRFEADRPRVSPDGRWILYYSKFVGHADPIRDLWAIDTVTGVDMPVYSSPYDIGTPDWSPDGNSIAYVVVNPYNYNDRNNREIYTDTFKGHTTDPYLRLILPVAGKRYIDTIDVDFLAFNAGPLTFEFSADGGSTWQVVRMGVNPQDRHFTFDMPGVFSPQCQLRVYDENHPDTVDAFAPGWYFSCGIVPPEYGNQLTNDKGVHWFVDWSPDGKYVTYGFSNDIWVSPVDGGQAINLTGNIGNTVNFPTFTPDSKSVTFSKYSGTSSNIVSLDIETMQETILIENGTNACWSHNGRYIVYRVRSTSELAVLDTETDQVSIIAPSDGGMYGVVSFTYGNL